MRATSFKSAGTKSPRRKDIGACSFAGMNGSALSCSIGPSKYSAIDSPSMFRTYSIDAPRRISRRAVAMAESRRVTIVATGDVRCARASDRRLLDALICLRERKTLDTVGRHLPPNGEGHIHSREEIVRRFRDRPDWILATREIAERCEFTLENLDYRFPQYPLRPGETQNQRLRELTRIGTRERYGHDPDPRVPKQIARELDVIEKLDLAGYFLIVEDISAFARREGILCQGRGVRSQ